MASKLSGEVNSDILIPGAGIVGLRTALAFGTSMAPFIKSGAELFLEPLPSGSLKAGDVIMFESSGIFITHRVVKIVQAEGKLFFQTKGDNRLNCDGLITEERIAGRVVRVNGKNIRTAGARFWGGILAFLSYTQAVLYRVISLPDSLKPFVSKFTNPLAWAASAESAKNRFRLRKLCRDLRRQGVLIEAGPAQDREAIAALWNEVFPEYSSTAARLSRFLFSGPRFEKSTLLAVKKSGRLLGWALFYPESEDSRIHWPLATGSIDILAVTEEGRSMKAETLLLQEISERFQRLKIRQAFLNPYPVPSYAEGIPITPSLVSASDFGFEPYRMSDEFVLKRESYRVPDGKAPEGIIFRSFQEKDEAGTRDFLKRSGRRDEGLFLDPASRSGLCVAACGEKIVGLCRWVPEDRIRDCGDVHWLWIASTPDRPRGFFSRLLVDQDFRMQGIGTALAARAFELLFQSGCEDILLITVREKTTARFYERFGFKRTGSFLKLRRPEKN